MTNAIRIVFVGDETATFTDGFAALLREPADIAVVSSALESDAERATFAAADVIVANRFSATLPHPARLRLLHVPAAGYDGIDMAAVPHAAAICNSFGHELAITEYVMAALLARCVPLTDADARLRRGDWAYWAGAPERAHPEMSEMTIGLFGFGHIGRTVAERARSFGMGVVAANRSPISSPLVDKVFPLDDLAFWSEADAIVVSIPLASETTGIVGVAQIAAMRSDAILMNVGRGPVIDEQALYDALVARRIGGAVIDTWYRYPTAAEPTRLPASLPFHELDNIVMTPHMSGWTRGTIRRRRDLIARNVNHLASNEPLENLVRAGR